MTVPGQIQRDDGVTRQPPKLGWPKQMRTARSMDQDDGLLCRFPPFVQRIIKSSFEGHFR
jgi:hypothetical protein